GGLGGEGGPPALFARARGIIGALTAPEPRLRVVYKPHPLTGTRDPRARRAHQQVVALIEQASRQREAGRPTAEGEPARLAAAADPSRVGAPLGSPARGGPPPGRRGGAAAPGGVAAGAPGPHAGPGGG